MTASTVESSARSPSGLPTVSGGIPLQEPLEGREAGVHGRPCKRMGGRERRRINSEQAGPAAAVEDEGAAVAEAGAVAGQEDGHAGHFFGGAVAALLHGDHLVELAFGEAQQAL